MWQNNPYDKLYFRIVLRQIQEKIQFVLSYPMVKEFLLYKYLHLLLFSSSSYKWFVSYCNFAFKISFIFLTIIFCSWISWSWQRVMGSSHKTKHPDVIDWAQSDVQPFSLAVQGSLTRIPSEVRYSLGPCVSLTEHWGLERVLPAQSGGGLELGARLLVLNPVLLSQHCVPAPRY